MPLPDKHADERLAEMPAGMYEQWVTYRDNAKRWAKLADEVKAAMIEVLEGNNATAVVVDGRKVAGYRPSSRFAEARMQQDHPDLCQHYRHTVSTDVFDVELFVRAFPDIAEQYRVRSFTELEP